MQRYRTAQFPDWYDVSNYTHKQENYDTYRYKGNVSLLTSIHPLSIDSSVFDTDILVLGHRPADERQPGLKAKEYGVKRVICELETNRSAKHVRDGSQAGLLALECLYFRHERWFNERRHRNALMLQMITGNSRLYEVVVNNARFDGIESVRFRSSKTSPVEFSETARRFLLHGSTQIQLVYATFCSTPRTSCQGCVPS